MKGWGRRVVTDGDKVRESEQVAPQIIHNYVCNYGSVSPTTGPSQQKAQRQTSDEGEDVSGQNSTFFF